jgi:hypothetical protein
MTIWAVQIGLIIVMCIGWFGFGYWIGRLHERRLG